MDGKITSEGGTLTGPPASLDQAKAIVETREFPRVTEASMKAKISEVRYFRHKHLTVALVEMKNGFMVLGKAAPADPRNYSQEVGERYAYEDAIKQLWPLEGYALCEHLDAESRRQPELALRRHLS